MRVDLKQGTFHVNLPTALYRRLEEVCNKDGRLDKQFCGFLLHLIISYDHYDDTENLEEGWVFLHSDFLRRFNHNGLKYNEQRDLLVRYGLIELRPHLCFPGGNRCKGYRIKEEFQHYPSGLSQVDGGQPFETSLPIERNHITKVIRKYIREAAFEADESTGHLTRWLKPEFLIMDQEAAKHFIHEVYNGPHQTHQFRKRLIAINKFGQFESYHRKGKDNRLHSYFTRFPKDLKPFVNHVSGKRLVEVDIKNSQPFIFSILLDILETYVWNPLKNDRGREQKEIIDIATRDIQNKINSISIYPLRVRSKIEGITNISQDSSGGLDFIEINSLKEAIRRRDFYQQFGDACLLSGAIRKSGNFYETKLFDKGCGYIRTMQFTSTRDCAKQIILNALYARGKGNTPGLKFFRNKYPSVSKVLDVLKTKDPTFLPLLMQRIEAKCVLDFCTKRISKRYPDMFLLTCHDSITTTEDRADELYNTFKELLEEFFGLPVRIERSIW